MRDEAALRRLRIEGFTFAVEIDLPGKRAQLALLTRARFEADHPTRWDGNSPATEPLGAGRVGVGPQKSGVTPPGDFTPGCTHRHRWFELRCFT